MSADRPLEAGVVVADIRCGRGDVVNLMARAFLASTFVGYDLSETAIESARREADAFTLRNARFEVRDAAMPPGSDDGIRTIGVVRLCA